LFHVQFYPKKKKPTENISKLFLNHLDFKYYQQPKLKLKLIFGAQVETGAQTGLGAQTGAGAT
jgi:hypothetical protein